MDAPLNAVGDVADMLAPALRAPFDVAREQYAAAVKAGMLPKSSIQSAQAARMIDSAERMTLGPLARKR